MSEPRRFWIVQTLVSYAIGKPVYRVMDERPTEFVHRTSASVFEVVEAKALDQAQERIAELEKTQKEDRQIMSNLAARISTMNKENSRLNALLNEAVEIMAQAKKVWPNQMRGSLLGQFVDKHSGDFWCDDCGSGSDTEFAHAHDCALIAKLKSEAKK